MKRRLFESIVQVYGCGWTAICQENRAWHLPNRATEWVELPELPPIDDSDATIAENQAIPVTGAVGQVIAYGVTPAPAVSEGER